MVTGFTDDETDGGDTPLVPTFKEALINAFSNELKDLFWGDCMEEDMP